MNKQGFTLLELLLSMGIFLLIFTTLTQGFLLVSKITQRLDVQREMTIYSSKLLTSINNDMDSLPLLTKERKEDSIVLEDSSTRSTVTYSLQRLLPEEMEQIRKKYPDPSLSLEDARVLVRKEQEKEYRYFSTTFLLQRAHIRVLPEESEECRFSPLASIEGTMIYIPKNARDSLRMEEILHTSFSSPEDPSSYLNRTCSP